MKQIHSSFQHLNKTFNYSIDFFEDQFFPYFKNLNIFLNEQHICLIDNLSMNDYLHAKFAKDFTKESLSYNISQLFSKTPFINDILSFIETHELQYIQNIESYLSTRYTFDNQWSFNISSIICKSFYELIPQNYPYTKSLSMFLYTDCFNEIEFIEESMFEYIFKMKHITSLFLEEQRKETNIKLNNFFQNITIDQFQGNLDKSNFSYFISLKMTNIIFHYFKKSLKRDHFEFEFFLKSGNKDIKDVLIDLNHYSPFTQQEMKSIVSILNNVDFLSEEQNFIDFLINNKNLCFKIISSSIIISKLPVNFVLELFTDDILTSKPQISFNSLTNFIFNYRHSISIDFCLKLIKFIDKQYKDNPVLMILFKNNFYDLSIEELSKIFKRDHKNLQVLIDNNYKLYEEQLLKLNLKDF